MSLTPSKMVELGMVAAHFALPNPLTGKIVHSDDFSEKDPLLVIFMCAHCPYVVHVKPELIRLGNDYRSRGVGIVGISANDPAAYPADAPSKLAKFSRELAARAPNPMRNSRRLGTRGTAGSTLFRGL